MKNILFILIIIILTGCSHKITTNYRLPDTSQLKGNCTPLIVKKKNLYGLQAKYLGSINLDEPFTYINRSVCSEAAAIEKLKSDACSLNSNLINITSEINPGEIVPPYPRSPCYRCIASYYSIDFNEITNSILEKSDRKIIKYDDINKLTWNDFALKFADSSLVPYEFISDIEVLAGNMSIWTGAFKEFKAQGVFYSDISKVKASFAIEKNLIQINVLYSLAEIYAKRLEQFLNSKKPKIANRKKIQYILENYLTNLRIEQKKFIAETDYGKNLIAQQEWVDRINQELNQIEVGK